MGDNKFPKSKMPNSTLCEFLVGDELEAAAGRIITESDFNERRSKLMNRRQDGSEKIIEKTRQRRQKLDEELNRSSSRSPTSKSHKIKKRKSSDRHSDDFESPKTKENQDNPPKKPSFDESDLTKPRRSLYPTDELNDLKQQNEKVEENQGGGCDSHVSKVEVKEGQRHVPPDGVQVLKCSSENVVNIESGSQPSTPSSRKARLAALAAQVEDFEVDMKRYIPSQKKEDKSQLQFGGRSAVVDSHSRSKGGSSGSESTFTVHKGTPEGKVRFNDSVMEKTISVVSSFTETESDSTLNKDANFDSVCSDLCGLEAFSRPKENCTRSGNSFSPTEIDSSSLGVTNEEHVCSQSMEISAETSEGLSTGDASCKMTTEVIRKIKSPPREDPVSSIVENARKAMEMVEEGGEERKQPVPDAEMPKTVSSMTGHWESRAQKEIQLPGFWIRKSVFEKPTAKPLMPTPGLWKSSVLSATSTPPPGCSDNRVSPQKETGERKTTVSQLKARWEISSVTGSPLHPRDDLTEAAVKLASTMFKPSTQKPWTPHSKTVKENVTESVSSDTPAAEEKELEGTEKPQGEAVSSVEDSGEERKSGTEYDSQSSGFDSKEPKSSSDDSQNSVFESDNRAFNDDSILKFVDCLEDELESSPEFQRQEDKMKSDEMSVKRRETTLQPGVSPQLVHSVSFYRSQQRQSRLISGEGVTPVVVKPPTSPTHGKQPPTDKSALRKAERQAYDNKVKLLNEAVNIQQEQIAQASRALNFCRTTQEFRGSREEVDAQRALLLATERRRCLIEELDRVSACRKDQKPIDCEGPRGTLTISHMSVPLKRQFVNDNINMTSGDLLHYFICVLKHRETVHATQMVTSDEGLRTGNLEFSNYMKLSGLPHDFVVRLEIFGLRTKREELSHEEKYRIKGGTMKSKSKALFSPGFSSPGGPMAVLDPSFQMLGHMQLSLHAVNRGKFRLDGVQFSCPIEGALLMKLRCFAESAGEVEDQGFLSAYEEISGLGSWTRLWCVLKKGAMKFWRYPDDQNCKEALNLVDLGRCITEKVKLMNREMCSRSNTFYIDIVAEIDSQKRTETFRIMLSADTKDECIRWCNSINQTLANMRMWNPESTRLDMLS